MSGAVMVNGRSPAHEGRGRFRDEDEEEVESGPLSLLIDVFPLSFSLARISFCALAAATTLSSLLTAMAPPELAVRTGAGPPPAGGSLSTRPTSSKKSFSSLR